MRSKNQADMLLDELCIRFDHKPRKCRKINDSGIGTSERIVSISNNTFFYYPKIQQFTDRDFDKLKYVVPKAGVKLAEIVQLKFPPRQKNQRNYFSITLPRNKILKYTKTLKEMIVDESAQGYQTWTFVFDYDIISLPELEERAQKKRNTEYQKAIQAKRKQQAEIARRQQERKRKLDQQYESLIEAEKAMAGQQDNEYNKNKLEKQKKQQIQKAIKQFDEYYFMEVYQKGYRNFITLEEQLDFQLDLLETVGRFTKRAERVAKKYIDEMPYQPKTTIGTQFRLDNLFILIGDSKAYNHEFLENCSVAHHIYEVRKEIRENFRIPLYCFVKYKGFKVLIRSVTPVDDYQGKNLQERTQHGMVDQIWKTHFLLSDQLTIIIQNMNLKPYTSQVTFLKATIHLGKQLRIIETNEDPFKKLRNLDEERFSDISKNKITYALNLKQVYPIDVDLENNINQIYVRLRPQYVQSFKGTKGESIKLTGGGLTYEYEDQEGSKNDLMLAKASQQLKYTTLFQLVKDLDSLKYVISDSNHLGTILKESGINIRYIGNIYKLTQLPYIREMVLIEAIGREIKKIYRDHQKQFVINYFRNVHQKQIQEAFNPKQMKSLQTLKRRELKNKENQESIANAIDYLNLIFGNSHETEAFWEIILKKVKDYFKIEYNNYLDLPHGYLLKTVLYHCGFDIKLSSSIVLFSSPDPFSIKDWARFVSKCECLMFPSMQVHKKTKITGQMTQKQIINRLELSLYLKRILNKDQASVLSKLALYTPNVEIPGSKFSVQNLLYHIQTPTKQKFQMTYEICSFIMPPNHPFFQQLYLQFATIKDFDPIMLKKAAENHAIRSLGITHWRTSEILSGFKQQAYLKHLISAENGIEFHKRMELFRKIIQQQFDLGRLIDCFLHTKKAISFVCALKEPLSPEEVLEYYKLMKIGMSATYKLRKIQDMLKISEYLWNALEEYIPSDSSSPEYYEDLQYLLKYSFRGYMESSQKKYYLFKLALIFQNRFSKIQEKEPKQYYLDELRVNCREAKNHINFIKEMLTKLQFGYAEINFEADFFTNFWQHVQRQRSEQLDQGLYEYSLFMRVYGLGFFEKALLNRTYTFDKGSKWDIPHIHDNNIKGK